MLFDDKYRETVSAKDGTRLLIRKLRPEDKPKLAEGFERLSPESRYRRFFTHKNSLTPGDLLFFTEFDGIHHFALGAAYLSEQGSEGDGVGIARFIRLPDNPSVAEFAVAVVDAMQNKGIGTLLCERLLAAAAERGVASFRCEVLALNQPMLALIKDFYPDAVFHREGSVVTTEFPIPQPLAPARVAAAQGLFTLLRQTARGIITARAVGAELGNIAVQARRGWRR